MNFVDPEDTNLPILAERLAELIEMIRKKPHVRGGQYGDSNFRYPDVWPTLPDAGLSRPLAFSAALEAFDGAIRPNSPNQMFNLSPSPMIDAVALAALTTQINPNAIWDLISGKFGLLEERCLRKLAGLAGWKSDPNVGGVFTTGGKATLFYAIKHGMRNAMPRASVDGVPSKVRVFASPYAHYSLESACNWLGIGRTACHRVKADAHGELDPVDLESELRRAVSSGFLIPVVVASGGSLIDTRVDNILEIRRVIDRVVVDCGMAYKPHLHVDAVVTWPWLAIGETDVSLGQLRAPVRDRVLAVSRRLSAISEADSFGVDFHKTGLAAYASSCYVTKQMSTLRSLEDVDPVESVELSRQGDRPTYQWSMENSRPSTGMIMADFVLNRLGRAGLSEYVCRLVGLSDELRQHLIGPYSSLGSIVNESSLGLDIVLRLNFRRTPNNVSGNGSTAESPDVRTYEEFREWLTSSDYALSNAVPVIGYVPLYKDGLPAFLLLPSSLYSDSYSAQSALNALLQAMRVFDEERRHSPRSVVLRRDVRPAPPR